MARPKTPPARSVWGSNTTEINAKSMVVPTPCSHVITPGSTTIALSASSSSSADNAAALVGAWDWDPL